MMIRRVTIAIIWLGCLASTAHSQMSTNETLDLVPRGGKISILSIDELPAEAQDFHRKRPLKKGSTGAFEHQVPREALNIVNGFEATAKDTRNIEKEIGFHLSALQRTPFAGLSFKGYSLEGAERPALRATRVFRSDKGQLIALTEWDYVTAGGGMLLLREYLNADINGTPGTIALRRGPEGNSVWQLTWATAKKEYGLYMTGVGPDAEMQDEILRFARSLQD
jgi:hypothetical protein